MKKLTAEEAAQISIKEHGRSSYARAMLLNMKPGEFILLENKDWKWKTQSPVTYCRGLEKHSKLKYECNRTADASGWLVKRVS